MKPIDPKYSIDIRPIRRKGSADLEPVIVKTATGEPIPDDEPLILFRARDRHALEMLFFYRHLCEQDQCTDFHLDGIENRLAAFKGFREKHPERMKQPGITRGL
jgi:hypothetical protein